MEGRELSMNALRNTCLWLLLLFSPLSTVGGEPETRTDDPTRAERSVTGWVAVEVVGENVVGVAVDAIRDGQKPDGSADYLALFSASQAVPDATPSPTSDRWRKHLPSTAKAAPSWKR